MRYNKNSYNNNCMTNYIIKNNWEYFLDEHQQYFLTDKEIWSINFLKLKKYINTHKKTPSFIDKDISIRRLAQWLNSNKKQKQTDNKQKQIFKKFLDEYQEYLLTNEEIWYNRLEKLKIYINKHKKNTH